MGFMDKVKAQAEQALAMAQQGVTQGQEKLDSLQTRRSADVLLRELGAAFYAEQRTGGSVDAVKAALAALDRHASEHGPVDTTPAGDAGAPTTSAAPDAGAGATTAPGSESFPPPSSFAPPTPQSTAPTFNQPGPFQRPE